MRTAVRPIGSVHIAQQNVRNSNKPFGTAKSRKVSGRSQFDSSDHGDTVAAVQDLRGDIAAVNHVNETLALAKGFVDMAAKSVDELLDHVLDLADIVVDLCDDTRSAEEKQDDHEDYDAHIQEMWASLDDAEFQGVNLLDWDQDSYIVIANISGGTIAVGTHTMAPMMANLETAPRTAEAASAMADTLEAAYKTLSAAANALAADYRRLHAQMDFHTTLADAAALTLGARVDPDLAKDRARLQARQAHYQLIGCTLSIANRAPKSLIGLL